MFKTHNSIRQITVDDVTMVRLREWFDFLKKYAEEVGPLFDNTKNLAFPNKAGRPIDPDTFRRRYFAKLVRYAGLPASVTMHSLRHTHCTLLLANGVAANVIAQRLGHSSAQLVWSV